MVRFKQFFYFVLINIIVSASTTLLVLYLWELSHPLPEPVAYNNTTVQNSPEATFTGATPDGVSQLTPLTSPTETLAPPPLGNVEEYEVQDGDTLGLIAEKFDVSIEEIMTVNQISDPNSLSAGMLLYIPIEGVILPTFTPQASRTPAPTQSGTPSAGTAARLIINSVIGPGELASEQVFLSRMGSGDLSLAGWKLEDEDGNVFVFPQLDLFQGGAVIVWTKGGSNTAVDLYWGLGSAVWEPGEAVTVRDAQGKVHTTYTIP